MENKGLDLEHYAAFFAQGGEDSSALLCEAYCRFMDGSEAAGGVIAAAVKDTLGRFISLQLLAERDGEGFAQYLAGELAAVDGLTGRFLAASGVSVPENAAPDELRRLAAGAILRFEPMEAVKAAPALPGERCGYYNPAAWEALSLYAASFDGGGTPEATVEQLCAAYWAEQCSCCLAHEEARGEVDANTAARRRRALGMVLGCMLLFIALSGEFFAVLFGGSIAAAVSSAHAARRLARENTAAFNSLLAAGLEESGAQVPELELEIDAGLAAPQPDAPRQSSRSRQRDAGGEERERLKI